MVAITDIRETAKPRPSKAKSVEIDVPNLVIVSDLHLFCQFGLCPPRVRLDGGGWYKRSPLQAVVWRWWLEFWGEYVPEATNNEPYAVCINGDAVDNRHHRTVSQVSQNLADQRRHATRVIEPIHERCKGRLFITRGTSPAHGGPSGEDEETIAEAVGAVPDGSGNTDNFARNDLWIQVGGALVHAMHHIGTSSRQAYETSAIMAELVEEHALAAQFGLRAPDIVARSHRHTNCEVSKPSSRGRCYSFTTSGWQLRTPFTYKIAGARIVPPQFGGSVIRQGRRNFYVDHYTRMIERARTVRSKVARPRKNGR